jgi:endonuclease YncB( thermonuclease family)
MFNVAMSNWPWLALAVAVLAIAPARSATLPACAGAVEIGGAQLLRVEKNGSVVLTDGRATRLEGIRLPAGATDRAPQQFADQALAALVAMTRLGPLTLTSMPPKEDRYDRVRGQLFGPKGEWIQLALLARGLARVSIAPDRTECADVLFAAEAKARAANIGIWSSAAYSIRTPASIAPDRGTFQIVEGRVLSARLKGGRAYLDFDGGFTVVIEPDDLRNFRTTGVDPRSYAGQTIRVRGIVQDQNGPMIEAANPQGIEVVQ